MPRLRNGCAREPGTRGKQRITGLPATERPDCLPDHALPAPCLPPSCLAAIPRLTLFHVALPDRNAYKNDGGVDGDLLLRSALGLRIDPRRAAHTTAREGGGLVHDQRATCDLAAALADRVQA